MIYHFDMLILTVTVIGFIALGVVYYHTQTRRQKLDNEMLKSEVKLLKQQNENLQKDLRLSTGQIKHLNNEVARLKGRRTESFIN